MAYELSSSVKYVNPILGFYTEGPWTGATLPLALAAAKAGIVDGIRVQGMGCIVKAGDETFARKYWFKDGVDDTDLVEFVSGVEIDDTQALLDKTWSSVKINNKNFRQLSCNTIAVANQNLSIQTIQGVNALNSLFTAQTNPADNGFYGWNGITWSKAIGTLNYTNEYDFLSHCLFTAIQGSEVGKGYLLNNSYGPFRFVAIGTTDLSITNRTATTLDIASSTGADATLDLGNGTLAGLSLNDYTSAEKSKLAGIAAGAEVNVNADWNALSGDAQILNKPTISGSNTGDQIITLAGDVTGSGTGSFTTTIANNAVTNVKAAQMAANTIKANNTGSTANAADLTTDQFTAMMEIAVAVGTTGIITAMTSATYKYIRLTSASATGLGSIIAPSSSYKDLYIWNDTGVTLTLYNEYLTEATAANRIICGANQNWANNTMLHLKYDVVEARWCLVTLEGSTYRPLLAGTGVRLVETSATGQEQAIIQTLDIDFTGPQQTSATSATWTGVNEVNIVGLLQGQLYIDYATTGYRYECHRNDWCSRTPIINVETFTTNSLYPILEVTGTSGTLAEDNAYVLNNASLVTMSLPSTGTLGKVIVVNGKGAGGWKITVPNTQQIVGGATNTTTAGSGYIEATGGTKQYAAVTLKCITGGTAAVWAIVSTNPATTLTIA